MYLTINITLIVLIVQMSRPLFLPFGPFEVVLLLGIKYRISNDLNNK